MNKNFDRTKEGGYLIRDSNLEATRTFYPPNVSDGDELNVGENDPDKVGAIATVTEGGVTGLYVYQGDGEWKSVGNTIKSVHNFTESDLLETSGDGNWYLELPFNEEIIIIEIKIDDVIVNSPRDNTFTPNRLYGFANNSTQTITITTI